MSRVQCDMIQSRVMTWGEDDDLGGGLLKNNLRNNSSPDATSSPIARIVSSSNGAKTQDECVKFDLAIFR